LESLFATNFVLDPIVAMLENVLHFLNGVTHNFGWSLVLLALGVKLVFWPLNSFQFKSITKMQALQPKMKALQAKYKGDQQRLQQETMALYKETGVNPFASCLPLLLQMPILASVYYAINSNCSDFAQASWGWIGSAMAHASPALGVFTTKCQGQVLHVPTHVLATSLLLPDYLLLALYVVSMYFSVRLSSPAMDEQQAQQQKIMALVSPVMIAFIGRGWPSALILYWLTFNALTMAQQFYLMRRYAPKPAVAGAGGALVVDEKSAPAAFAEAAPRPNGSPRSRRKRGSRR
jgi:YidC/Oxa1 family membrane protein insertase